MNMIKNLAEKKCNIFVTKIPEAHYESEYLINLRTTGTVSSFWLLKQCIDHWLEYRKRHEPISFLNKYQTTNILIV